ncbi:phenylacetate--CoA ligase family protein [Loktanella sp. Alg231-35]|uniref:phenylacetate--CoA ligase family protein n=1 Tax=Loktanella sp. Alg231-35 TaxID=1922220 RepID=UPI000D55BB99|nr:AMP-binding protein [Loktanella sp. Alg231-35]
MSMLHPHETRSADARETDQLTQLKAQLAPEAAAQMASLADLSKLPVLRKSELSAAQAANPPFGGIATKGITRLFQSPGPIYEPGGDGGDWWRFASALRAGGIGAGDVVQNTFSYHFTPAGAMFESAAIAVGAQVFAAGPGQTELQVRAAKDLGVTAYAGTPDYLGAILAKADEMGVDLPRLTKALVSGGPLFPTVRQAYGARGIACLQCYGTADVGNIAYETVANEPMIVDEGALVEIVTPGTGNPVAIGDIGEVVVTPLNPAYPLVRFATGDLSAVVPGHSSCGRTNMRLAGWKGRADQATKIKGMFVRPEQVASLVARHPEIARARVEVSHDGQRDEMVVKLETQATDEAPFSASVRDLLKLSGTIELVSPGSLPRDGVVIADLR